MKGGIRLIRRRGQWCDIEGWNTLTWGQQREGSRHSVGGREEGGRKGGREGEGEDKATLY